jgi:hypothetical protein
MQQKQQRVIISSQLVHRPVAAAAPLSLRPPCRIRIKNTTAARRVLSAHRVVVIQNSSDNIFVRGVVAAATEVLRLFNVGASTPSPTATGTTFPGSPARPAPGDIDEVLRCLKSDFERSYFITGVLSDGIYDEDCFFADPTVSFTGRELWKRNLQLLVPFLIDPSIQLTGLQQLEKKDGSEIVKLRADWILECSLKLPWRPYIYVVGSTEYDLAYPDNNRIVRHVEYWDISAWEALVLVFTPGFVTGRKK